EEKINISYLSKKLNISIVPLREALSKIHLTKLIILEPNKGYKVSSILNEQEMIDLIEARVLLERYASNYVIRNNLTNVVTDISNITSQMENLVINGFDDNALTFIHLDRKFHSTIMEATKNSFVVDAYKALYSHFHIARYYHLRGEIDQAEVVKEHNKIIETIKNRDVYSAELALMKHITDSKDRLLNQKKFNF